jgi:hypothetical protein
MRHWKIQVLTICIKEYIMHKINHIIFNIIIISFFLACNAESESLEEYPQVKEDHHPFLIVTRDEFSALRDNSDQEPWKSIKEDAIKRAHAGSKTSSYDLQYFIGAAALAYILDEENSMEHARRVRDAILHQYLELELDEGGAWGGVVPPMSSFFVAILALDIVYDALNVEDILDCEEVIENQIFKISRQGAWVDARRGTHGTWDIYKGIRTSPDDDYYEGIMYQITEDGVSPVTNHYAWERVGGGNSRISKSGYMDVLEFTGIDPRYYNNERLKKFQRWLFGSSVNCSREMAIFGDMLPTQGISNDMLHRRVVNFDMEAAGYAAWFHEGRPAIGHILTYILPKEELPVPIVPSSKIYSNGGAFFREKEDEPNGLHAVLYNIQTQDEWHTHNEVNGLALSGLGNRLLVNGGRLGEPTRAAYLNNTLTINGENHDARLGGGIEEGFTIDGFDYACGYSGPAMSNATHYRNLILMHGSENTSPYFVTFDEVVAESNDQIKNYLHPANETTVAIISPGWEYEAAIDHYPSIEGSKLTFYYGTKPLEVNIEKVQSAVPDRYPDYPDHNRMEAVYETNADGLLNIVTLLIPHGSDAEKPNVQRISEGGISGAMVGHATGINDVILESPGEQEYLYEGISFTGESMISRQVNQGNAFYFIRKGTYFHLNGTGFHSDDPVSIYVSGTKGVILSAGAQLTLSGPGADQISFSSDVTVLETGENFIKVELPAGEVRF